MQIKQNAYWAMLGDVDSAGKLDADLMRAYLESYYMVCAKARMREWER